MTDVFLSYHNHDRARVARIADLLRSHGWSVWWDQELRAGESWDETIEHELYAARCVVVCWSVRAVQSHWVKEEASFGRKRGILVPVMLDREEPPIGFQLVHALDMHDWRGAPNATAARELVFCVEDVLRLSQPPPAISAPGRRSRGLRIAALIGGVTVAALFGRSALEPGSNLHKVTAASPSKALPTTPTLRPVPAAQSVSAPVPSLARQDDRHRSGGSLPPISQESDVRHAATRSRGHKSSACRRQTSEALCEALPECDWVPVAKISSGASACRVQRH